VERHQLGLAGGTEVVEQAGPRLEPCTGEDALEAGTEIGVRLAVLGDDVLSTGLDVFKVPEQERPQVGEERDEPLILAGVWLGLERAQVSRSQIVTRLLRDSTHSERMNKWEPYTGAQMQSRPVELVPVE